MADEVAGRLFQDQTTERFEDAPLRLAISTKNFLQTLEPLVSSKRIEIAKRHGPKGLSDLKRLISMELEKVEALLSEEHSPNPPSPHEDQVVMVVTLRRQQKHQAGFAYFNHRNTTDIRTEREARLKCNGNPTDSQQPMTTYREENDVERQAQPEECFDVDF